MEICVEDGYSLSELRRCSNRSETIRDCRRKLSCCSTAGRERKGSPDADVRARLAVFLDTLRPRMAPAYAVVVSSAIASAAEAAQREAEVAGLRVGLFQDFDRARRWLSGYAPASSHSLTDRLPGSSATAPPDPLDIVLLYEDNNFIAREAGRRVRGNPVERRRSAARARLPGETEGGVQWNLWSSF